ncbi:MAG: U32 family peptidase [Lachnospiraceae bacterium]|nr:U32 family peptidase [Lachnospiraceae bacterium]
MSPAGDLECFVAAINAGADAVYLALDRFGARAGAKNLTEEELIRALDTAHMNSKRIYLTVNTLFKDCELDELHDLLYRPYINGLDAVIVQDIGVMKKIGMLFPKLPIHVSTQSGITGSDGIRYLKGINIKRVVPARELSLKEIEALKDQTGIEIECFIHGSLCYSYSGKCLLSSFIGQRSGNRGRCAQPCRLPYDGTYPLSLKDLCVIDHIPDLIGAGISSFKIEGRMKSSDYVYNVTSIYRKYIDMYYGDSGYKVDPEDKKRLISVYTRSGNCNGYYYRHNDKDMITLESPSYVSSQGDANEKDMTKLPVMPVNGAITIKKDKTIRISVYNDDTGIDLDTGIIAQTAINHALTKEDVIKQIQKTGGTNFRFENIDIELDEGLFLQNSKINEIRRQGLDAFYQKLVEEFKRIPPKPFIDAGSDITKLTNENSKVKINASVLDKEQLDTVLSTDVDGVIIPMWLYRNIGGSVFDTGKDIYISLPYIVRDESRTNSSSEIRGLVKEIQGNEAVKGFYVSNLESLGILNESSYKGKIIGDIHLYSYNREALKYYTDNGLTGNTVPIELNEHDLESRGIKGEELIIYGRLPMMITANCIYNTEKACGVSKEGHDLYITDRKGEKLFVKCICRECTNIIYNSVPILLADEEKLFEKLKPSSVRLSFTDEKPSEVKSMIEKYLINKRTDGYAPVSLCERYTRGHIKRGAI